MKAVITVIGKDSIGIIATVSAECAKYGVNIVDITQSVLKDYFAMIMIIDITQMNCDIDELRGRLAKNVPEMIIHVMHEDIFNSMHRI